MEWEAFKVSVIHRLFEHKFTVKDDIVGDMVIIEAGQSEHEIEKMKKLIAGIFNSYSDFGGLGSKMSDIKIPSIEIRNKRAFEDVNRHLEEIRIRLLMIRKNYNDNKILKKLEPVEMESIMPSDIEAHCENIGSAIHQFNILLKNDELLEVDYET